MPLFAVVYGSGAGNKPLLSCIDPKGYNQNLSVQGARVVIETDSDVYLIGACGVNGEEL